MLKPDHGLSDLSRRLDRPSQFVTAARLPIGGLQDLRTQERSGDLDRSTHRRFTWLYEDLLN